MVYKTGNSFGSPLFGRSYEMDTLVGYRFGINTQEKDDEIYGKGNASSAEFWEYDSRLGRRWNLDPIPQISISDYACFGNNPIWRNDILGNKWKDRSDEKQASSLNSKLESRKGELNREADKLTKRGDRLASKGKEKRANEKYLAAAEARKGAMAMEKAQSEIAEMGSSQTEFTFKFNLGANSHSTYKDKDGTIVIEYGSNATAIHELTHAHQHIDGQVEFVAGTKGGLYIDLTDEQNAYVRQYFFDPSSFSGIKTASEIVIYTSNDISLSWVSQIWVPTTDNQSRVYLYTGFGSIPIERTPQHIGEKFIKRNKLLCAKKLLKKILKSINITMKFRIFYNFFLLIFISSCGLFHKNYWNKEQLKIKSCFNQWNYEDLKLESKMKVLLFNSGFDYDISSYPNLVIGIIESGDTIGILDMDFKGGIKKGDLIKVYPLSWTDDEKEIKKPSFTVSKNHKDNDLYCKVKIIYYGRIKN
jgi:hypothetical protein